MAETNLDKEQRDYVETVQSSAKILLHIVNDILDFSKVESGRLDIEEVPFNLTVSIKEVVKLMAFDARRRSLDFQCVDGCPRDLEVLGDPARIRQVLMNLLTNALKFTGEGGSVKLSVTSEPKDDHVEVCFMVRDTGIGIDANTLENLFSPYSQGDSSTARLYGGTGLGLAISKNVCAPCRMLSSR